MAAGTAELQGRTVVGRCGGTQPVCRQAAPHPRYPRRRHPRVRDAQTRLDRRGVADARANRADSRGTDTDRSPHLGRRRGIRTIATLKGSAGAALAFARAMATFQVAFAVAVHASDAVDDRRFDLDIERQSGGAALVELGETTDIQIAVPSDVARGIDLGPIKGSYTVGGALDALLEGSGLGYRFTADSVAIVFEQSKLGGEGVERGRADRSGRCWTASRPRRGRRHHRFAALACAGPDGPSGRRIRPRRDRVERRHVHGGVRAPHSAEFQRAVFEWRCVRRQLRQHQQLLRSGRGKPARPWRACHVGAHRRQAYRPGRRVRRSNRRQPDTAIDDRTHRSDLRRRIRHLRCRRSGRGRELRHPGGLPRPGREHTPLLGPTRRHRRNEDHVR